MIKNIKKLPWLILVWLIFAACKNDTPVVPDIPTVIQEGMNYSLAEPNADNELTITFKAPVSSALYGYTGDVYIHTGVISEGTWRYVPAEWSQNLDKCKMTSLGNNTWSIKLSPTIRQWYASGETCVNKLGFVIRSADGSKKGLAEDAFVTVTDTKYKPFTPAAVISKPLPANVKYGINIIDKSTVTLVLYDKDKNGTRKDFAHVIGDFNNWTLSNTDKSQMYRDDNTGCWWITLTGLDAAKEYAFQYYAGTTAGEIIRLTDPYSSKILDPDNDKYISSATYPDNKTYPAGGVGLVSVFKTQEDTYPWQVPDFKMSSAENLVIYELLLRDFTLSGDLNGALQRLDYLKTLGVTAVELMPVQEFDGNNSWGYNPNHYFAPDKAYGTPSIYKRFIDECHKRGMGVILDMVFNQASGSCPFAKLYWDYTNNRPAANNPWMNPMAPHPYSVFNDFNHSYTGTRDYFKRVLQYWITEYKVDGYRMDLTKGFTQTSSTEATAGNYDASRVDILTDYYNAVKVAKADAVFILEHLAGNEEETALANKGMYLWRNMNNVYSQAAMGWSDATGGYADFSGMISSPHRWVGYAESHDEERNFYKAKTWGNDIVKTDSIVRIGRVPLNVAFAVLTPGPKMIWQFEELGYDYSIDALGGRTSPKPSAFGWLNLAHRKAAYDKCCKIISLKKLYPNAFINGIYNTQIGKDNWTGKRIALTHADLNMIMLGNFSPNAKVSIKADFVHTGTWYNLLTGETLNVADTGMSMEVNGGEVKIFIDK